MLHRHSVSACPTGRVSLEGIVTPGSHLMLPLGAAASDDNPGLVPVAPVGRFTFAIESKSKSKSKSKSREMASPRDPDLKGLLSHRVSLISNPS